jgi:hypothetical protein
MAEDNLTLMIEANRRGLLPPDQKATFDEAVRRGLMPSSASGMDRFMMGATDPGRGIMEIVQQIVGKPEAKAETPDPNAKPKDVKIPGEVISPTDPMRIAGNVANPANLITPLAASRVTALSPMAKTVLSGTIPALLQPLGETNDFLGEKTKQGVTGAALGYGFSVAGKGVSKGMDALGRWLVSRYPENIASHAVSLVLKRIEQDRAGGGLTARNMVELVRLAGTQNKPLTLSDVGGKNVERLAGNIYRSGGSAANTAETLYETRDSAAANRLRQDIAKYVHGGMTVFEATEALLTSRSAAARPLYEQTDKLQGIWSPRLGEFFKDPVIKDGMKRGYELEKMVSLAENRAFDPTAMGVDIADPNNITFLRAPNMRVLDMAKQGLDAMIADERNAITGRLSARGVALDKLKRSYVSEIDNLDTTGVYKKARAAWGGYSASLDALKSGRAVFQASPEENAALAKSLSPSDQEFYRMGVADMLNERLAKTGFSSDEAKALIKNDWAKGQLKPAFKSEQEFNEFVDSVAMESMMFGRRRAITGGSQTAERMVEDQSELIKRAEASASIAGKLAGGHYFKAVADFYRMHKDLGLRSDPKMNEVVAKILFSPLPPHAKTESARAVRSILSPPPPGQGNYLQGPARSVQDLIAPALASETGEISGGRPLPLPRYAEGGVSAGGQAVVGEDGPEVVNLPPGAKVIPNHKLPGSSVDWLRQYLPTAVGDYLSKREQQAMAPISAREVAGDAISTAANIMPAGRLGPMSFKSPWGFKDYSNVSPAQHVINLKTRIGQLSRDLTEFNKRYPGEAHSGREELRRFRQELKDLQSYLSDLPHYQEGGITPGGPVVVGERGPEVVEPPPDIDSLLRQMGSGPAPPPGEPMTRALPGYEQRSPGELAMIRTQEATRPTRGRADITPEHAAQMLLAAGGTYAAPEQLLARGIAAAPKTMTALLAALGVGTGPTEAGESAFSEPEPKRPSEIQTQIDSINTKINPKRTALDKLKANFAAGRIDKQEFERRRVPLEGEIGRAADDIKSIDAPFQRQLTAWETRKNDALTEQSKADEVRRQKLADAELPFRVKHPEATQNIIKGGTGLTGLTALLTGLLSKGKIKPTLGVAGVGGLEGAVTSNIPEWLDLGGFQPVGGEAWKKTRDQQLSLDNLIKTISEAGVHAAGAGAISYGSSFGPKVADRIKSYFSPGKRPPSSPPSPPGPTGGLAPPSVGPGGLTTPPAPGGMPGMMSAPSTLPATSPATSGPPTMVRSGITYEFTSSGWRVQAGQKGGGRFMKNPPEWPSWLPKEGQ